MKKLAILSPLVILMASTSLAQDSCIVRPSCADMGYTKTEADCTGKTTLKCPFDLTKVSCEEEDSSSGGEWDWEYSISCEQLGYTTITFAEEKLYKMPLGLKGCFVHLAATSYSVGMRFNFLDAEDNSLVLRSIYGPATICVDGKTTVAYGTYEHCIFIPYKSEVKAKDNSSCEVGDYYFDDDTCSFFNIKDKTAIGVVVDAENRKILSIEKQNSLRFALDSTSYTKVYSKITSTTDGEANTNKLIAAGASKFPVAQYCYSMTSGNKTWYVPASDEFAMSPRITAFLYPTKYDSYNIFTSTQFSSSNVIYKDKTGENIDTSALTSGISYYAVCMAKY